MTPGSEHKGRIRDAVSAVLAEHRGRPIQQGDLAREVGSRLGLAALAETTLRRRCKEAVGSLVASGVRIASDGRGYQLSDTPEADAAGRRYLARQLAGIAKRWRAYDSAGAEKLQQFALSFTKGL